MYQNVISDVHGDVFVDFLINTNICSLNRRNQVYNDFTFKTFLHLYRIQVVRCGLINNSTLSFGYFLRMFSVVKSIAPLSSQEHYTYCKLFFCNFPR